MPLTGEYEPSTARYARKQVEKYEATNGEKSGDMRGRPVIVLTSIGAKSGKLRKTPLMRVEHDGEYAVVASLGGAPEHPVWYYNLKANPHVELQDRDTKRDYTARDYYAQVDGLGYKQVVALADPTGETTKRRLQAAIRMGPAQPIPVVRDSWNQGAAARVGPNESRGYH